MNVTTFPDQRAFEKTDRLVSLIGMARGVLEATAPAKEKLPWFKCAQFGDDTSFSPSKLSYRCNANVQTISGKSKPTMTRVRCRHTYPPNFSRRQVLRP